MLAQDVSSYEWPDHCKGEKTQYSHLAPEFTSDPEKINQPLGIKKARKIAFELGIKKSMLFTRQEYREFIGTRASRKMNPNQALIYDCVQVLTNSSANPIKVDTDGDRKPDEKVILGSYGLSVINNDSQAYIQTDCYETSCGYEANCLQFNSLVDGYLQRWSIEHNTYKKWREMIKLRSFKKLTYASINCQNEFVDDNACIVNLKGPEENAYAGVPMAPTLWLINFMFLYKMNPKVAAKMPGYAAHLPTDFAKAMIQAQADESYGLPYAEYINELPGTTSIPLRRDQGAKKTNSNDPLHGHSSPTNEAEDKITLSKKSSARLINSKQLGLADADDPLIAPEKFNKSKSQLMMEDVDDQVLFSVGRTIGSDADLDSINFSTLFGIQATFSSNEVSPAMLDLPSV